MERKQKLNIIIDMIERKEITLKEAKKQILFLFNVSDSVCVDYQNYAICKRWAKQIDGCKNCKIHPYK